MSNPTHILLLAGLVFGYVVPAVLVAWLADRRGRSLAVYLVASLIIGWIVPLAIVLIAPRRAVSTDAPLNGAESGAP